MEIVKAVVEAIIAGKEWGLIAGFLLIFWLIIRRILQAEKERDEIDMERENKLLDSLGKCHDNLPKISAGFDRMVDSVKSLNGIVAANTKTTELLGEKIAALTAEVRQHGETLDDHEAAIKRLEQIEKGDYLEQHN